MFRYLVLVCIFIICSYIGFVIGENYKKRSVNLKEFQKAILLMNNDVIYTNIPLMEALYDVSEKVSGELSQMFREIASTLEKGEANSVFDIFNNIYGKYENDLSFKKEDYSIVSDFFRTLGETGVFGQEKIFKLASEQVKLNYQEALKEAKVNIKMYRTLGVCAGVLIVIFFI